MEVVTQPTLEGCYGINTLECKTLSKAGPVIVLLIIALPPPPELLREGPI